MCHSTARTLRVGLSSNHKYPHLPSDLHLAYQERYAAQHSDLVVSPSRYMVGQLKEVLGWVFPGEIEVLGLPMPEPPGLRRFSILVSSRQSAVSSISVGWKSARASETSSKRLSI